MFRRLASLPVLLVFIVALAGPQAAFADRAPGKTLVGAWEVFIDSNEPPAGPGEAPGDPDGVPDAFDITVINRDGTVSNSDPALGTGHGIWRRLGASQFEVKFKTPVPLVNALQQLPGTTLTVTLIERGPQDNIPTSNDPFRWVDSLGVEATEWR